MKSTARAPLSGKNVKQHREDFMKNNTCMTVSRYVQLTVHKYGQEARLGPRFQFICKVQEVVMDKCEDRGGSGMAGGIRTRKASYD